MVEMAIDDANDVVERGAHVAVVLQASREQVLEDLRVHLRLTEAL